jgi:uncharacterized cupin superfamily protein
VPPRPERTRVPQAAGESWTLADQPHIHVMQERMPPGSAERRHLHGSVEQLYYILHGVGTVRFDDHDEILRPGDAVHIPRPHPTSCATSRRKRSSSW